MMIFFFWIYKDDAEKASDSRYLHRGAFLWELADKRKDLSTVQGQLFQMLNRLEQIRRQENVFSQEAEVYTTFNSGDYGYGMSLATFTFLLSLVITGIYSILTRERGE